MRDIFIGLAIAIAFFTLLVSWKKLEVEIARECNKVGGLYFDGICQRPHLGMP